MIMPQPMVAGDVFLPVSDLTSVWAEPVVSGSPQWGHEVALTDTCLLQAGQFVSLVLVADGCTF